MTRRRRTLIITASVLLPVGVILAALVGSAVMLEPMLSAAKDRYIAAAQQHVLSAAGSALGLDDLGLSLPDLLTGDLSHIDVTAMCRKAGGAATECEAVAALTDTSGNLGTACRQAGLDADCRQFAAPADAVLLRDLPQICLQATLTDRECAALASVLAAQIARTLPRTQNRR